MSTVAYLPIWKKNATAEERLLELASIARTNPSKFDKFLIIYQEISPDGEYTQERTLAFNCTTNEVLGLLKLGEHKILKFEE